MKMKPVHIDAKDLHYTPLNQKIRAAVADGVKEIIIDNVLGQRFIADGLRGDEVTITIQWRSRRGPCHVHERSDDYCSWKC